MDRKELFRQILTEHGYQPQQITSLWETMPYEVNFESDDTFEFATRYMGRSVKPQNFEGWDAEK